MTSLETALQAVSDFVWGPPLLILLFGTHLFLTVRLRFIQRYLPQAIRLSLSREKTRGASALGWNGCRAIFSRRWPEESSGWYCAIRRT